MMKKWLLAILVLLLSGCKTIERQVPVLVPTIIRDTIVIHQTAIDTIYQQDSTHIKGDTIERYRTIYKVKQRIDTLRVVNIDSISTPVYITETKTIKQVPLWAWASLGGFLALLFVTITIIVIKTKSK